MKEKLIKSGDRTVVVSKFGDFKEILNRLPNREASFALDLIGVLAGSDVGAKLPPNAIVGRAFEISRLAHLHIKKMRMDTPFPFAKVFPDDQQDA